MRTISRDRGGFPGRHNSKGLKTGQRFPEEAFREFKSIGLGTGASVHGNVPNLVTPSVEGK